MRFLLESRLTLFQMHGVTPGLSTDQERLSSADRLDSWKEIAEYLKRSVRTVRRWEAEEGLPAHRHHHRSSGTIYAFKSELEGWFASRRTELEREPSDPVSTDGSSQLDVTVSSPMTAATSLRGRGVAVLRSASRVGWLPGIIAAAFVGLALVLIYSGAWRGRNVGAASSPPIHALAVLPLANLTGDPGQDYFADGMTEALITELARMGDVRVISRTSVVQYKGEPKRLPEIARDLNVDGIVEGAVVRSGTRVRITAQLIDARRDRHLWASSYERDLDDVIGLQREVARAISQEVSGRLREARQEARPSRRVNAEAYDALLRAQQAHGQGMWTDAIAYCEKAIAKQPDLAVAYALMGLLYMQFEFAGGVSPQEYMSKAEAAARKALELDETLAEAHTVLAAVLYRLHWDWRESEKEFRRALELNPNYTIGHRIFSVFLLVRGRIKEAVAEAERARQLDPLSIQTMLNLAEDYRADGQFERALAELETVLKKEARNPRAHFELAQTYLRTAKLTQAASEIETAVSLSSSPRFLPFLAYVYGLNGRQGDARKVIEEISSLAERQYVAPAQIGLAHLAVDETDAALTWFNKAVQEHDPDLVFLIRGTWLDRVRSDARFAEVLAPLGGTSSTTLDRGAIDSPRR